MRRGVLVAVLALPVVLAAAPIARAGSSVPVPTKLEAADALAGGPVSRERDRALLDWAKRASLADLLYVLRRSPAELGSLEARLAEAALKLADRSRIALRSRLRARVGLVDPDRARSGKGEATGLSRGALLYPRASVFLTAALLPDSGNYQAFGRSVLEGIRAGLSPRGAALPITIEARSTGEGDPARAATAFDSAADRAGSVVGELLSVPTLVLATATRFASLPLVSPTATDETIGAISPMVFQVGPSGYERGMTLAREILRGERPRVGVLVSSDLERSPFASGFVAAAEARGATVVWRGTYAPGAPSFAAETRSLLAKQVELLFWDGEAREAESLVRQLTRERVSVKICGGAALAPENHHASTRVLLEGVRYVGQDWELSPPVRARLDSLTAEKLEDRTSPLLVQGYVAGRFLEAAVAGGALCPEEIAAFLATNTASEPYLRSRGFLAVPPAWATLPIYAVMRGKSVLVRR